MSRTISPGGGFWVGSVTPPGITSGTLPVLASTCDAAREVRKLRDAVELEERMIGRVV